jgi:hypothetical protein
MSESKEPLRDQLAEAINKVRRELEILRPPSSIGGGAARVVATDWSPAVQPK